MTVINAYAAKEAEAELVPYTYTPDALGAHEVEVRVDACGICHSDLSMIDNEWRRSTYPLVPGHEAVGEIVAVGDGVTTHAVGDTVGVGWTSYCCTTCRQCLSGHQQRCPRAVSTIRAKGGFADRVIVQDIWAVPIPEGMDPQKAGPLFCGGITVFAPFVTYDVKPTDHVAVVGIGGLGHLALQVARAWGCEVTAFTTSEDKFDEARDLGAHHVVNTRDEDALKALRGKYDFILSTVAVDLPWAKYVSALAPAGRLVTVGMPQAPMGVRAGGLVTGGKQVGGSDTGPPAMVADMLGFCARHGIEPVVEFFPMEEVNAAMQHLRDGKARYRVVLVNDG